MPSRFTFFIAASVLAAFVSMGEAGERTMPARTPHASIDAGLQAILDAALPNEYISTLVYLREQVNVPHFIQHIGLANADRAMRHREVALTLIENANLTQRELLTLLQGLQQAGQVERFESLWITNAIHVVATADALREIANHRDVELIFFDFPIEIVMPDGAAIGNNVRRDFSINGEPEQISSGIEPGLEAVRAPEVWQELGYTGQGVLIATMDTGVDGNHAALADRWRGRDVRYHGQPQWAWFDQIHGTTFPTEFDGGSHGTHVTGIAAGGAPGDQIGVAPGAQWMHAGVIDQGGVGATIVNAMLAFQWMAAPTGDAQDTWAVPHVASNSWGTSAAVGHPDCDETFWQWIDNSEAMGTVQLFAAGNSATAGLVRPADRAIDDFRNTAVASINPHDPAWPIAPSSSRGPTYCTIDGTEAIKPDIAAPGVGIRSSVAGGGYGSKNGTSMAAPHVNGVVALMFEACPNLTVEQIKQILFDTAVDLGPAGKDNDFGWGMVDAYEAVLEAEQQCGLLLRLPSGVPAHLTPEEPTLLAVTIVEGLESIVPDSPLFYYRDTPQQQFDAIPLIHVAGSQYEVEMPPMECGDVLEFYVSVTGDGGTVRTHPIDAPHSFHRAIVGEPTVHAAVEVDFEAGLPDGWSISGLWNVTDACPVSGDCAGSQWAYYGIPQSCNYNTDGPNSGSMISSPISVPNLPIGATARLSFCYNLASESSPTWDVAKFLINDGQYEVQFSNSASWNTHVVDVTAYAGTDLVLEWHFDSVDGLFNNSRGWQIGNVVLEVTSANCGPSVVGDLNGDGVVDVSDLLILLANWGPCPRNGDCLADLNGDGVVDVSDLLILLGNWG